MLTSVMSCIVIDLSIESLIFLFCLSSYIVFGDNITSFSPLHFTLVSLFRFSSRFCFKTFEYESVFLISFSIFSSALFILSIFFCKSFICCVSVSSFFRFLHRLVKLNFNHLSYAIFTFSQSVNIFKKFCFEIFMHLLQYKFPHTSQYIHCRECPLFL